MAALQHRIVRPCQCDRCTPQPPVQHRADPIRRQPYYWPQVQPLDTAPTVMRPAWPRGGAQ